MSNHLFTAEVVAAIRAGDLVHFNGRSWRIKAVCLGDHVRESAVEVVALDRLPPSGAGMRDVQTMLVPIAILPAGSVYRCLPQSKDLES